ncbi:hypothetical protein JAAARDRAFT_27995 [Jaapia argillacea MUCL 33604]|uniref:Uncharacterized protein n=1 Tax=Jaapia argillacea MUCL 33604 TaxID=933084 RepID=A0A067QBM0_9AGAM|nr:hypothetical protein JAAARDRAFT_27995 [Jaapia argillacea MUCL 33604]
MSSGPTTSSSSTKTTTPSSGGQGDLRSKVVEILANTANGCLHELGYFPGIIQRLRKTEAINAGLTSDMKKLYEDNHKLARMVRNHQNHLALAGSPNDQQVQQIMTLTDQVSLLGKERDHLERENQSFRAAFPVDNDSRRLLTELTELQAKYRFAMDQIAMLRAELARREPLPRGQFHQRRHSAQMIHDAQPQRVVSQPNARPAGQLERRRASEGTILQHTQMPANLSYPTVEGWTNVPQPFHQYTPPGLNAGVVHSPTEFSGPMVPTPAQLLSHPFNPGHQRPPPPAHSHPQPLTQQSLATHHHYPQPTSPGFEHNSPVPASSTGDSHSLPITPTFSSMDGQHPEQESTSTLLLPSVADPFSHLNNTISGYRRSSTDADLFESNGCEEGGIRKRARLENGGETAEGQAIEVNFESGGDSGGTLEVIEEESEEGLRPIIECVDSIFEEEENEQGQQIRTCVMCKLRFDSGLTQEHPQAFVQPTVDDLVEHCKNEHPAAWEHLRQSASELD